MSCGCGSGFAEYRLVELLPPAKRGRPYAETMSPAGDINLSRKVIGELRKVYGAAASWPPCGIGCGLRPVRRVHGRRLPRRWEFQWVGESPPTPTPTRTVGRSLTVEVAPMTRSTSRVSTSCCSTYRSAEPIHPNTSPPRRLRRGAGLPASPAQDGERTAAYGGSGEGVAEGRQGCGCPPPCPQRQSRFRAHE